jgi:hypothetical protein
MLFLGTQAHEALAETWFDIRNLDSNLLLWPDIF